MSHITAASMRSIRAVLVLSTLALVALAPPALSQVRPVVTVYASPT